MATLAEARQTFNALPKAEQKAFKAGLEQPASDRARMVLWIVVLGILGVTIFLFGYLGFNQLASGGDATALLALATTALGFIGGLFATSPVKG